MSKKVRREKAVEPPALAFARSVAKLALARHLEDVVILDLRGISSAMDFFVIGTGTSDRQMKSVADEICLMAKERGFCQLGREGYRLAHWILLDFLEVVVHLFTQEYRQYYDLEMLWGEAKRISIEG
ncbi:MAG: ribosome silencing factor [Sedimentisphaerales bacterium]|nr:ribosome silencing factor [Sedimentisphaerales bacterium]